MRELQKQVSDLQGFMGQHGGSTSQLSTAGPSTIEPRHEDEGNAQQSEPETAINSDGYQLAEVSLTTAEAEDCFLQ